MTTATMLAKVRTFLDESSASFWTDVEVYASLAHGQISVIEFLFAIYQQKRRIDPDTGLPEELRSLTTYVASSMAASALALPSGFLWLLSAKWDHDATGGGLPCRVINIDRSFDFHISNTFLAPTSADPVAYVGASVSTGNQSINFLPVYSTTGAYQIYYLKHPTAIAAGQEPTLPEVTHNAIVEYATYAMLMKDQRPQEAQVHYNLYSQELKAMLGV